MTIDDDKFRGKKLSEILKIDDELERDARALDQALGEVTREVFDPTNPANCPIWNEAGAVAEFTFLVECSLDGIKVGVPEGRTAAVWIDSDTMAELFELAARWHIYSFTANQIIGTAQNKRLGLPPPEESES